MTVKDVHYLSIDLKRAEVVERWNSGKPLLSVRLSDLADAGVEFEDTLQQLMFEIYSRWGYTHSLSGRNNTYSRLFVDHCVKIGLEYPELNMVQFHLAKDYAWRLLFYGYNYMMKGAPEDRLMKVQKTERKLKLTEEVRCDDCLNKPCTCKGKKR